MARDVLLHLKRLVFRWWPLATAKLLLVGRPSGAAVAAEQYQAIPRLDDVPERPEVVGPTGRVERLIQLRVELRTVGIGKGGPDQLCPLRQVRSA